MFELVILLLLFGIPSFILLSWCCGSNKSKPPNNKGKESITATNTQSESMLERLKMDKKNAVITVCLEKVLTSMQYF